MKHEGGCHRKKAGRVRWVRALAGPAMIAVLAAACAGPKEPPQVLTAFALFAPGAGGSTIAYVRVIVDGARAECPSLTGSAGGKPMLMSARDNPDAKLFPVTVCEVAIGFGAAYSVSGGPTIAAVQPDPATVLVYGDTGCDSSQACDDSSAWPFPVLAAAGVGRAPDLILHMGDYNYRGTPGSVMIGDKKHEVYDGGDHHEKDPECSLERTYHSENATNSSEQDEWQNWWLDFFEPAADLLPVAPWVFTRGNHELCSRAGPGWFYFLDAGSNLPGAASPQRRCPDQDVTKPLLKTDLAQLELAAPYVVDLGNLRVATLDSANACDNFAPEKTSEIYTAQFDSLGDPLAGDTPAFFMTHRPLWAVTGPSKTINHTLQAALGQLPAGRLPDSVQLSLSGHMHLFESLTFVAGGRPPQIVVGNSGVELAHVIEAGGDAATSCIPENTVNDAEACGNSAAQFGFLELSRQPDGSWSGVVIGPDGAMVATCSVPGSPVCSLKAQPCDCPPAVHSGARPPLAAKRDLGWG